MVDGSEEVFEKLYDLGNRNPKAFIIASTFMGMDAHQSHIMLKVVQQSGGDYQWFKSITSARRSFVRVNGLTLMFSNGTASWA